MDGKLLEAINYLRERGYEFEPEDVSDFEKTRLPEQLREYYRDYGWPNVEGEFELLESFVIPMELAILPGETLAPYGLIPIANSPGNGDVLCIDTTTFKSPSEGGEIYMYDVGNYSDMTYARVIGMGMKKANSFADLLMKLPALTTYDA